MPLTTEQQVFKFVRDGNRPFNVQLLVDGLQKFGIKKGQVTKALDSLVDKGEVTAKEFGKSKIFFVRQDAENVLSKEELEAKRAALKEVQGKNAEIGAKLSALRAEKAQLMSIMTAEEVDKEINRLTSEITEAEGQIKALKGASVPTVTKEDMDMYKQAFVIYMDAWRKRRRIFRDIWDTVSENLEGKTSELFEEIGVETDEAAGADYTACEQLMRECNAAKRQRA